MAVKGTLAALAAVATLASCGSVADDPLLGVARSITSGVFNREDPAPAINPRQVLTRDIITQAGLPLILVENEARGVALTMVRSATNGPNETWQGDGDATIALSREGVLRATRGAGADLYAADIAGTRAALVARRAGVIDRLYVHEVGALEQRQLGYRCAISFAGSESVAIFGQARSLTRVVEACSAATDIEGFENRYWIDSTGFAWASEQWAGPELGHYRIERLFR